MHQPAFPYAVPREPVDALLQRTDPRPRREDFKHEIRRSPDAVRDDTHTRLGDDDVGLNNEVPVAIEDDIDWRQPHTTPAALFDVIS